MKKLISIAIGILVLSLVLLPDITYAMCGMCGSGSSHEHKEGEIINKECPVMGGKVDKDTPYKVEYKGKTIGFCCTDCIEKFNAEPEKYMKKIKEQEKH